MRYVLIVKHVNIQKQYIPFRITYIVVAVIAAKEFVFVVTNEVNIEIEVKNVVNESDGSDDDGDVIVYRSMQ